VKDRSVITQPPVIARAVEIVYERSQDRKFLEFMLEPVIKFYEWLHRERTDKDNLVFIINPWESGMDDITKWDTVFGIKGMQKAKMLIMYMKLIKECNRVSWDIEEIKKLDIFVVKDVSFNVIYILGMNSLASLCDLTGRKEDAKKFRERAEKTTESLIRKCWHSHSSFFYDLYSSNDKMVEELTVTGLFPIALENTGKDKTDALVNEHLLNKEEFWSEYPIPSVSLSSKKFSPKGGAPSLWRGTTWINCNWYIVNGLLRHGYAGVAKEISKRTLEMVEKSGFREHYNPLDGMGYGAKNFGWSTLAVEMEEKSR
jgi:glycogen debranching enzyme